MLKKNVSGIQIEFTQGDIVKQKDITAIVNAANAQLKIGGGVAGAIYRAAGPDLEKECEPLAPIEPGEAVVTGGHDLPNDYVIHCLGPVYGKDVPADKLLADCYRNALNLAEKKQIEAIAFPAISTGAFGYPVQEAAEIALKTIKEMALKLENVNIIRFVLFSDSDYEVHKEKFNQIFN